MVPFSPDLARSNRKMAAVLDKLFQLTNRGSNVRRGLLLVLTVVGARVWLAHAIPTSLKQSFAAGIGLFLLFIGLKEAGLVEINLPDAPLKIAEWGTPQLLAVAGFVIMAWLMSLGVRGAILIGIAVIAVTGVLLGLADAPT